MARGRKKAQGLGDTIEQITEVTGIKAVVEKFSKATGAIVDTTNEKKY
jgi:hypothetical protein